MRKIILLIICCMSVGLSLSYGQSNLNESDIFLEEMFKYAKTQNIKALEELKDKVESRKDRQLMSVYSLALYIAAPEKYKQQYVDNFPVNFDDINYFNERIEMKGLTPSFLYFIDAIGAIAEEGNDKAIKKVIMGVSHSDGGAAELFCDTLTKLFDKQLQKTLKAFSQIDETQRQKSYICFELMEAKEFNSVKSRLNELAPKATKSELNTIHEINNYH